PPPSPRAPYPTLFRSRERLHRLRAGRPAGGGRRRGRAGRPDRLRGPRPGGHRVRRVPEAADRRAAAARPEDPLAALRRGHDPVGDRRGVGSPTDARPPAAVAPPRGTAQGADRRGGTGPRPAPRLPPRTRVTLRRGLTVEEWPGRVPGPSRATCPPLRGGGTGRRTGAGRCRSRGHPAYGPVTRRVRRAATLPWPAANPAGRRGARGRGRRGAPGPRRRPG